MDKVTDIDFITVGIGKPNKKLFGEIRNRKYFCKPSGGLWASPYTPDEQFSSEWIEFNTVEMDGVHYRGYKFNISKSAKVYVINSLPDLIKLVERFPVHDEELPIAIRQKYIDFEKASLEYDAIFLTRNGEYETRYTTTYSLYGWDVESILIFNFDIIENLEVINLKDVNELKTYKLFNKSEVAFVEGSDTYTQKEFESLCLKAKDKLEECNFGFNLNLMCKMLNRLYDLQIVDKIDIQDSNTIIQGECNIATL